jgi:hypothetical protein
MMGITCRECGEPLRDATLFGVEIRRKPEKVAQSTPAVDAGEDVRDNVTTSR